MPKPNEGEGRDDFVSRCIPVVLKDGTAEDNEQAAAVCHSLYEEAHKALDMMAEGMASFGDTIKAMTSGDNTLTVAAYGIRYGSEAERDMQGEWFAPDTDYGPGGGNGVVTMFHHGIPLKAELTELARRTFAPVKAVADNVGIFVEAVLDLADEYQAAIAKLVQAGKLRWSSGTAAHLIDVDQASGKIKRWHPIEFSYTPAAAEPRLPAIAPVKALFEYAFSSLEPQAEPVKGAAADGPGEATATDNQTIQEDTTMSDKEKEAEAVDIAAIVKKAAEDAVKAYQVEMARVKSAGFAGVEDRADRALQGNPFKSLGEQLLAVKNAAYGYVDERLLPLQVKAVLGQSEQVASEGGFLIGVEQSAALDKKVFESGVFASRVQNRTLGQGTNSADFYGVDEDSRAAGSRFGGVRGYRVAEAATITASRMSFFKYTLKPSKYAVLVYATDEVLQDQNLLEQEIMEAAPLELAFMLDDDILNGVAAGYPRGVLAANCLVSVTKETGQAADTIVAANIDKMWARRWIRGSYAWFVNQDCNPQLDALNRGVGTGGALVYSPPGGIADVPYGRLKGAPVIETEFNATVGTVGDILLADFSQYKAAQAGSMQAASSIHVQFLTDQTAFRFTARYDGQPTWKAALTPYKGAGTISPFVAVASRD